MTAPSHAEPWRADAEYFKSLSSREGWPFAAAVACSVQPDLGHGKRNDHSDSGKVSASEFARVAGTTAPRVMRYFKIWEAAANENYVSPAETLTPGSAESLSLPTETPWRSLSALVKEIAAENVTPLPTTPPATEGDKEKKDPIALMASALNEASKMAKATFEKPDYSDHDRAQIMKVATKMIALGTSIMNRAQKPGGNATPEQAA